jgi:UDP-glucose 6-dehydrogenase
MRDCRMSKRVIVGFGNCGKAVGKLLEFLRLDFEVFDIDKSKTQGYKVAYNFVGTFLHICVPEFQIKDAVIHTRGAEYILIHSTMPIGMTRKIQNKVNVPLAYMPLFFRERHLEDIYKPQRVLLGLPTGSNNDESYAPFIEFAKLYSLKVGAIFKLVTYETAELIKLATNGIRACLITLYNELFRVAKNYEVEQEFINCLPDALDITKVATWEREYYPWGNDPNLIGKPYAGSCLPKDVRYLKYYSKLFELLDLLNSKYADY